MRPLHANLAMLRVSPALIPLPLLVHPVWLRGRRVHQQEVPAVVAHPLCQLPVLLLPVWPVTSPVRPVVPRALLPVPNVWLQGLC